MQIEMPDDLAAAVAEIAGQTGQPVDALIAEMVTEAIKMRRVPGILFADGPTGRRARIGGTGIEVFEVVQAFIAADRDRGVTLRAFDWLGERQVDAAIAVVPGTWRRDDFTRIAQAILRLAMDYRDAPVENLFVYLR